MNEQLTALYIRASILSKNAKDKTKEIIKNLFVDETGGLNVVEIVVLIGVAVLLAVVFKNQIAGILNTLFSKINGSAGGAVGDQPVAPVTTP